MNNQALKVALGILVSSPDLIERIGLLPNIKTPTMGGELWWNNLAQCDGWRVQRNSVTGHCRILDEQDVRHAWGAESKVMEFFQKVLDGR
ncbi:MAG: hypothetical protein IBX50_16230 [Marinospirillum sp.]|uniref:hypothetical protein n=1 Tax=Marinospirillum sp. TaxID=2183934 RepID=UPI0019DB47A9|nr:hypothetical protein [Marinospirillum sp.]MBE0508237.1 hypothetical protein [Marinospirillum sp.]